MLVLVPVRGRDYAAISCDFRSGAADRVKNTAQ
jgi:hypothetical protein